MKSIFDDNSNQQTKKTSIFGNDYSGGNDYSNDYISIEPDSSNTRSIFNTNSDPNYYSNKNISDSTKTLNDNNIDVPKPDVAQEPKKAWYEKYIFDPISSLSYGLASGTKNLADDNKDTGFFQGFGKGFSSGFDSNNDETQNRTSWKEVLDTLLSSQDVNKRETTAFINNLINPMAWQDLSNGIDALETAKAHTGLTGFAGDVLLDPMNLLGGLGGASKLLSKGSKGIEAVKDLEKFGDLGKATEVLSRLQDTVKTEQAKYLVDKTAKFMGKMPDYKGITLGTNAHNIQLIKPETIAKLGNTIPFKLINSALDIAKESEIGKGIDKLFGGGQYGDILRSAKANPETAMENLAYVDVLKRLKNINIGHNLNVEANVEDFLKGIGNSNDEIVKKAEQGDIYKQVPNGTIDVQKANPEFDPAFHQDLLNRQNKLEQLKGMLRDVNRQLEHALPSERAGLLSQIDELTNEIDNQRVASEQIASNVDSVKPLEKPLEANASQENTLGLVDTVKPSVKPSVKPVETNKPILEQIHELDNQLGRKPTKFIDGTTEEQMAKTLERRKADLNISEPSKVETVKPTIEEVINKKNKEYDSQMPLNRLTKEQISKESKPLLEKYFSENKQISNSLGNSTAKGEDRGQWLDSLISNDGKIESKNIDDITKENISLDRHFEPVTEKQAEVISRIVSNLKRTNPVAYDEVKKLIGGDFKKLNQAKIEDLFNNLESIKKATLETDFTPRHANMVAEGLNRKSKQLYAIARQNGKENLMAKANEIQNAIKTKYPKNSKIANQMYDKVNSYIAEAKAIEIVDKTEQAIKDNVVPMVIKQSDKKELINAVSETPIEKLVAVTDNPSVKQKLTEIKSTVEAFDIKAQDLANKKTGLERCIKILETEIQSPEVRLKAFKREFGEKYPEYITAQEQVFKNEKVKGAYDDLPVGAKATAERITEEFKRIGIEEGIITKEQSEGLYNYVAHIMNFDHRNNQEYIDLFNKEIKNPNNKHAKERGLEGTIAEINKYMETKHGVKDFFETNIVKIYAERAMAHNKYMFDKDIVQKTVDLYGKKFDFTALKGLDDESYKEAMKEFHEMKDSGKYSVVRLEDKYSPVDVLALKGKSKEEAQNLFRNHMPFSEVSLQDIEKRTLMEYKDQPLYLVPKEAHKNYLKIAEGQYKHESNGLLKTFDKFMGLWKASALFSASFHINNAIGNTFNSYLSIGSDILNPKLNTYAFQIINPFAKDTTEVMGKTIKEWKETLHNYGVLDRDMISNEFKDFRQNKIENLNPNPLKKLNPYKLSQDVGGKIEHQARVVNFLSHIKNGKTEQEASDLVNKFLFDYSDLTDVEQNTMKRIVPFYTWLRKNIPLQLEQVFNNPAKYGKIYRGTKDISEKETDEQKKLKPDYLKNAIYRGNNKYLSMNLPYNDLSKATDIKELAGGINPLLKLAVELGTNKNLYFDSPIAQREGDMVQAPTYLKGIAKDTPNGKMLDAKLRYALRNLLPSVEQVSNGYDVLSGNKGDESKFNAFTKGGKVTEVDFKKLKEQALRDYATKMTNSVANNKEQGYIKKKDTTKKKSIFD